MGVFLDFENFNMVCSPARVRLLYGGQEVTVGGQPLILEFHHVHTMVQENRPIAFWEQGTPAFIQATLLIPSTIGQVDDPAARQHLQDLFGSKEVINFLGDALPDRVDLEEIMWSEPFRVPSEEKALLTPFSLLVTAP